MLRSQKREKKKDQSPTRTISARVVSSTVSMEGELQKHASVTEKNTISIPATPNKHPCSHNIVTETMTFILNGSDQLP
jgi:hypothetical protein